MKIEKLNGIRAKPYPVRLWFGNSRKAHYFSTKREAQEFKILAKRQPSLLQQIHRERKSLFTFVEDYLERKSIDLKPASILKYRESLKIYVGPELGHLDLSDIKRIQVENFKTWLSRKDISSSSKNFHFNFLKSLLKDAFHLDLIDKNPANGVRGFPKSESRQEAWSEQELIRFLEYNQENPRLVLYLLAANLGCRLGELLGLKKSDVDFENRIIHVQRSYDQKTKELSSTKTKTKRFVALPDELHEYLVRHILQTEGEFVIPKNLPGLTDPKHASRVLRVDCKKAGVRPIRFHDLRHTWATLFVAKSGNVLHAQRLLGHKGLAMTARYVQTSLEQIKAHRNTLSIVPRSIAANIDEANLISKCNKIATNSGE